MENVSDYFTRKTVLCSGEERDTNRDEIQTNNIKISDNQVALNGGSGNQGPSNDIKYKTKIDPDGRIVRVMLSDGETSSGIESVSSISSVVSLNDYASNDIKPHIENVLVEVKNEIALEYSESERVKTFKKVSIYEKKIIKGVEGNANVSPTYDCNAQDLYESRTETMNSCDNQQSNKQRAGSRAESMKSPETMSRKSKKSMELNRSRKQSFKRSNSSDRSRSVSSQRRRLLSHERKYSKNSARRRDRSYSRSSRSLSRKRRRSASRKRPRSSSRKSRSLSRKRHRSWSRRSRSWSGRYRSCSRRSRSCSKGTRSRSVSRRRRYRSLSRRSRSTVRRRSRSMSERKSRSTTQRSSKSMSKRLRSKSKSKSRKRSKSHDEKPTTYERKESEKPEEGSSASGSYYSKTETRKGRFVNGGYHSTTVQVHSGYFQPFVDTGQYYWRPAYRLPRNHVNAIYHPKNRYSIGGNVNYYPGRKFYKKQNFEFTKSGTSSSSSSTSSSSTSSSKDCSADGSQEEYQPGSPSEVNAKVSVPKKKVSRDTQNRLLPKVSEVTENGSSKNSTSLLPLPTVGVDNLSLIRGSNGLPVHISPTGKRIPYDMEGRRIPIGPNGHYLPVDAAGRLFPHVITLDNNAVPIYLSDDGVLRLPDSRPVPFGSPHKLPVNIDGKMILMGPDSRPLVPSQIRNIPPLPKVAKESEQNKSSDHQTNEQSESNTRDDNADKDEVTIVSPTNDINETRTVVSDSDNGSVETNTLAQNPTETESAPNSSSDPVLKKLIDCIYDNLLGKFQEFTEQQGSEVGADKPRCKIDDVTLMKLKAALMKLYETNFNAPSRGRFIVPKTVFEPLESGMEFESPLLKKRINLPFITPGAVENSDPVEKEVPFTFSSSGNFNISEYLSKNEKEDEVQIIEEYCGKDKRIKKPKTAEAGTQCDFTSGIIGESNSAVSKLKKEVVSLQNAYKTLLEMYERSCARRNTVSKNKQ